MLTIRALGAVALTILLALPASRALGAEPTLSDIAACNEEATVQTSPSALPRAASPAPPTGGSAPIGKGEKSDPTGSIVTGSDDPLVKGMDAQRTGDPAYRTAYRECMKARSERGG